jgi:hypothetical protein
MTKTPILGRSPPRLVGLEFGKDAHHAGQRRDRTSNVEESVDLKSGLTGIVMRCEPAPLHHRGVDAGKHRVLQGEGVCYACSPVAAMTEPWRRRKRHAWNWMQINMAEEKRNHGKLVPPSTKAVLVLPENSIELNQAALKWLREAKADAAPYGLHLLSLAHWGLENGVQGEWPDRDGSSVELQVGLLLGWEAQNVIDWLLSNPNGPDRSEQEANLLSCLENAESAKQAAAYVLSEIYYRQTA